MVNKPFSLTLNKFYFQVYLHKSCHRLTCTLKPEYFNMKHYIHKRLLKTLVLEHLKRFTIG